MTPPLEDASLALHVLVAEDNAINRRILAAQLEKLGCRCTMAADGEEALAVLQQDASIDAVLMDCDMPRLNGWETTRQLRAWAAKPSSTTLEHRAAALPVIALTAAILPEDRKRCFEAGMTDYLSKPIKLAALHAAFHRVIGARGTVA